ncbi:8503_t:CDS:2, partial [Dentiscutata erythropus]
WTVNSVEVSKKFRIYQMNLLISIKEGRKKLTWNDTIEILALLSIMIMCFLCPYSTFTTSEWIKVLDSNPYKVTNPILTSSLTTSLYEATHNFSLGLNSKFTNNNESDELWEKANRIFNNMKEDAHQDISVDPCIVDDITVLNSEIKPLGCSPLKAKKDFIKVHLKGKKSINQFYEKGGPRKALAFLNIADTIESFFIDLEYDGIYRSWPILKNKIATDEGSLPLMVLTFSHFLKLEQFVCEIANEYESRPSPGSYTTATD